MCREETIYLLYCIVLSQIGWFGYDAKDIHKTTDKIIREQQCGLGTM